MNPTTVRKLVYAALCLCLGLAMPWIFHLFGAVSGQIFLPMHIPVLLCGFVAGPGAGAACGAILPLLSSALTGMPPLFPVAPAMACELAAYGFATGWLHAKWHKIYPSLLLAMAAGRLVSGLAGALFMGMAGNPYTLSIWAAGAFVTPIPGIALQLILVPALVKALEKAGVLRGGPVSAPD